MRCLSYGTRCRMCRKYADPSQGRWEVGDPIEDRRVGVPVLHSKETEVQFLGSVDILSAKTT